MGGDKQKIRVKASTEAMRWADDGQQAQILRGPTEAGNDFDIRMADEPDGLVAAQKIVDILRERGVCLIQANAPMELLEAAYDEAESLWEDGEFKPPLRVHDDRSMMEAQLWHQTLQDEDRAVWIRDSESKAIKLKNALKLLARNIVDFCGGLGPLLAKDLGLEFDRLGQVMLTSYTGDRRYALHIDNPHGEKKPEDGGLPDNGMRISCSYFINPHWDPSEGEQGGLDVFLTDPRSTEQLSALGAQKFPRLRVAPHADTLVIFLSEKMAHQVIATTGKIRWYAMHLWCLDGAAMQQMAKKIMELRNPRSKDDSDDD